MTEKTEALRLADELDGMTVNEFYEALGDEAAAQLRRLSAENERLHQINQSHEMKLSVRGYEIQIADLEAQRDALKQTLHDELAGNLRLRDLGGARPDEPMLTFLERIIAERDALLEALQALYDEQQGPPLIRHQAAWEAAMEKARAAIKAVEGEKT